MSAADRMVVRTREGAYRSVPRRQGLGMISRGQAQAAPAGAPAVSPAPADAAGVDPLGPHGDEYQAPPATVSSYEDDPELEERRRALGLKHDGEFMAVRGPIIYPNLEPASGEPDDDVPTVEAAELPAEPRGNASRQEWAEYAVSLGVEVTDGMSRNRIRDAAQDVAQTLDRLPQPALSGGRLETPEDEPAAERLADDEDPGTR